MLARRAGAFELAFEFELAPTLAEQIVAGGGELFVETAEFAAVSSRSSSPPANGLGLI